VQNNCHSVFYLNDGNLPLSIVEIGMHTYKWIRNMVEKREEEQNERMSHSRFF
jgi:hypothetical protein